MQKSSVIALFLSSATTINLGFSDMPEGEYNLDSSFVQTTARSAASIQSGVRAKWVELPDCRKWCNFIDPVTLKGLEPAGDGQPEGLYIPLRDDLANAIIATCKGPEPAPGPAVCIDPIAPVAPGAFVANPATMIYDPVWKSDTVIPDNEHQVNPYSAANTTYASNQPVGPKGDFYGHWNWAYQSTGAQWNNDDGAYGANYTDDMTAEDSIGSVVYAAPTAVGTDSGASSAAAPIDYVQLDFMEGHDKKWVELPDCSGAGDEIILADKLENASVATCKTRPAL